MNKAQLINEVAAAGGLKKKDAAAAVDATINSIVNSIRKGEKVQLSGFGTFETKVRGARTGRNPKTGETVMIPECRCSIHTSKLKNPSRITGIIQTGRHSDGALCVAGM